MKMQWKLAVAMTGMWSGLAMAESHAALKGRVTDGSGSAIAGAEVTAREANGLTSRATTGESGDYRFDELAAGAYSVRIVKAGFAVFQAEQVRVKGAVTLDSQLSVNAPARAITARRDLFSAPMQRQFLAAIEPHWRHVKLVTPDWLAPQSAPVLPAGAWLRDTARYRMDLSYQTASQAPALAQIGGPLQQQAPIRFRITF